MAQQPARYRLRRTTAANRTNETPEQSELIHETDTGRLYIGDGSTAGGVLLVDPSGGGGSGDMLKSVYDADNDGVVEAADLAALLSDGADSSTAAEVRAHIDSTSNPHSVSAAQVGADPTGTAASAVAAHEAAADPHTQYLELDGTDAMAGALDMGGFAITNVGTVDGRDVSVDGTTLDTHTGNLTIHRSINDAGTSTTTLWSADKILTELGLKVDAADVSATPGTADAIVQADASGDISLSWLPDMAATTMLGRQALSGTGPPQAMSASNAFLNILSPFPANCLAGTQGTPGLGLAIAAAVNSVYARGASGALQNVTFSAGQFLGMLASGGLLPVDLKTALLDSSVDYAPITIIWAEEGGNMSTGVASGYQFSFGNGATSSGNGVAFSHPMRLIGMGCNFGSSLNTSTVGVRKNGPGGSTVATVTGSGTSSVAYSTGLSVDFAAGDVLNFITPATSGTVIGPNVPFATLIRI